MVRNRTSVKIKLRVTPRLKQFMLIKCITMCPRVHYLVEYSTLLVPTVKIPLKGRRFESIIDIKAATTVQLMTLMKDKIAILFRN